MGRLSSGEKVMAVTVLLPLTNGSTSGAIRYIVSLRAIDAQQRQIAAMILIFCFFSLLLVTISGLFFVRSIVNPVKKINEAARRIAKGDFSSIVVESYNRNDEIGELCETVNYMSDEISRTEKIKNDFISTVSHELRTPLTAIKGWVETLESMIPESDKDPDATVKKGLEIISSESDRLYSMVEDLLDFSKMQNGSMSLRKTRIDVLAELDETVYVFRDRARREGKELSYNSPDDAAPMTADPDRIKQVFVNILDNAVKYTPQGGRITVTAAIGDGALKIVFSDTGCGISAEDLPHVKEKFYKGNMSVHGSGIGLAVCDELISMHGGSLSIASVPGEGTDVCVTLPLEVRAAPADERK